MALRGSRERRAVERTRRWLEADGWTVERCEWSQTIRVRGRTWWRKKDLWAADLIARSRRGFVLVQVKANRGDLSSGRKALEEQVGEWPEGTGLVAWHWPLRARKPVVAWAGTVPGWAGEWDGRVDRSRRRRRRALDGAEKGPGRPVTASRDEKGP